ncbi:hypothetical protein MHYP_G00090970 [Metynnis hypsauchen]
MITYLQRANEKDQLQPQEQRLTQPIRSRLEPRSGCYSCFWNVAESDEFQPLLLSE